MLAGKKIIFLLGNMELGGAERQAMLLARHLQEREHARIEVWGIGEPGRVAQMCDDSGIPWENIPLNFGAGVVRDFIEVVRFSRRLREAAPDVLLPYTWFPNVLCGLVWRFSGPGICVWNQRDSGVFLDPTRVVHRLAVKLTPFFVSNSTHAATFLMDRFRVDRQRLAVIPNGVRLELPRNDRISWRDRLGAGEGDFVGCMVANFSQLKDHGTAVRAWRRVVGQLAACNRRALLVLAGRDDGTAHSISLLIRELGLGGDVRILDAVDDVPGLLAACDMGVHCSEHEGCPNAVLEEMAVGLPVVASDNSGVRMVLGEGGEVFLAPYRDSEGLAQRILEFAMDGHYRAKVGKNNKQRILDCYSVEAMCSHATRFIENAFKG
ncbi:glycosyltransferase [Oryzomonas japonica]|nr:glycosyltransferase [Oryzomonas japonica]